MGLHTGIASVLIVTGDGRNLSPLPKLKVRNTKAPHGQRTEIYSTASKVQWRSRQDHPTFSCHSTRAHVKKDVHMLALPSILLGASPHGQDMDEAE